MKILQAKPTGLMPWGHPHISLYLQERILQFFKDPPHLQPHRTVPVVPADAMNGNTQCHKSHLLTPGAEQAAGTDKLL